MVSLKTEIYILVKLSIGKITDLLTSRLSNIGVQNESDLNLNLSTVVIPKVVFDEKWGRTSPKMYVVEMCKYCPDKWVYLWTVCVSMCGSAYIC